MNTIKYEPSEEFIKYLHEKGSGYYYTKFAQKNIPWSELRTPIERIFHKPYAKLTQSSLIWVPSCNTLLMGKL